MRQPSGPTKVLLITNHSKDRYLYSIVLQLRPPMGKVVLDWIICLNYKTLLDREVIIRWDKTIGGPVFILRCLNCGTLLYIEEV